MAEIFRGGPDQGDPPDIDILQQFIQGGALFQGFLEGVKVAHDHIDHGNPVFFNIGLVTLEMSSRQDPAEDRGVKGFDPAAKQMRVPGKVFHLLDGHARLPDVLRGPGTGDDLPTQVGQVLRQAGHFSLVEDRDKSALLAHDRFSFQRLGPSRSIRVLV